MTLTDYRRQIDDVDSRLVDLFAERMRDMLTSLAASPPLVLRLMGLCGMGLWLLVVWLSRGLG